MGDTELKDAIERWYELSADRLPNDAESRFLEFREKLSRGEVRAAQPGPHGWVVNAWVKKGILLGFRLGRIEDFSNCDVSSLLEQLSANTEYEIEGHWLEIYGRCSSCRSLTKTAVPG